MSTIRAFRGSSDGSHCSPYLYARLGVALNGPKWPQSACTQPEMAYFGPPRWPDLH